MSWSSPGSDPADMFPFLLLHHAPATNMGILWTVVAINERQSRAILLPPLVAWYKFRNHYARWRGRLSRPRSDARLPSHTPGFQTRLMPVSVHAAKRACGGCSNYLCECPKGPGRVDRAIILEDLH